MMTVAFYVFAVLLVAVIFRVAYLYGHSVARRDIAEIGKAVKDEQLEIAAKPKPDSADVARRMREGKL